MRLLRVVIVMAPLFLLLGVACTDIMAQAAARSQPGIVVHQDRWTSQKVVVWRCKAPALTLRPFAAWERGGQMATHEEMARLEASGLCYRVFAHIIVRNILARVPVEMKDGTELGLYAARVEMRGIYGRETFHALFMAGTVRTERNGRERSHYAPERGA